MTMICLACGDCCNRMSPLTHGKCPHVLEIEASFFVCKVYPFRPKECVDHNFPSHVCPIGLSVLGICDSETMRIRADRACELQQK